MPNKEPEEDLDLLPEDTQDYLVSGKLFQGNENIMRKEAVIKWTPAMVDELKLCTKSLLHFAENHFFIRSLDEGKQKISLYKCQKRVLKAFKANRFNLVLASRQVGKSTMVSIYALWFVCFQADKSITVIANKESTATELFSRIQMAYEQLPVYLKPGVKNWTKNGMILSNGSKIQVSSTSSAGPRGSSSNVVIIDEAAHISKEIMKELWKSAIPVISSSKTAQLFVISTPNGKDNKFYELIMESQKPDSEWHSETIRWDEIPGRDPKWKASTMATLGSEADWNQEFELQFHEGSSVVDDSYLEELKAQCKDPLLVDDNGSYRVYELPQEGHLYVVGVDVGEGIGRTNSVAQVYDVTDPTAIIQVAVYANNNVSPYHFGTKVMGIMNDWGRPPCLIENNNDGKQVIDVLIHTHNYENLVTYQLDGMSKHYNNAGRYGIHSHSNTKYKGIANFRYWTNSLKAVRFYDLDTLLEMHNVVKLPNYTFGKRKTDDLDDRVLATVWGLFILDPSLAVKHFLIEEADAQGRPLKIKHLYNNESIKNSPLLQGKISVGPKGNARVNVSPCYIGDQETAHLSDEQQLFIWLHQDGAFKEEVPEIKDVGLLDDTSEVINHFPAMIF